MIKSGLVHLENKIEEMSKNETESERLYDIVLLEIFFILIIKAKNEKD